MTDKVTLYNVTSADGYIARNDGSEDFIPSDLWNYSLDIFKQFDCLLMGRKTYEAIQKYEEELLDSFEKLNIKKIVITHNKDLELEQGYELTHSIEDVLSHFSNILVSSGPTLNNYLFKNNLVGQVILHQLPIQIGDGIKAFDDEFRDRLTLTSKHNLGIVDELVYNI